MRRRTILFPVLLAVWMAGCAGIANLRLNESLVQLYGAKLEADRSGDYFVAESVNEGFRDLASRAEAEARSARRTEDAISFYRLAATAAWQGGMTEVVELGEAGWEKCGGRIETAPRDCGMLLIIPELAAIDERIGILEDLRRRMDDGAEVSDGEVLELFDGFARRFEDLDDDRAVLLGSTLPPGFARAVDERAKSAYCSLQRALGLVTLQGVDEDEKRARQDRFQAIKDGFALAAEAGC